MSRDAILEKIGAIAEECEAAAYQRGWNDAVAQIVNITAMKFPTKPATSFIDEVEQAVCLHDGVSGHEVTDLIWENHPDRERKILDRTVRTALRRLRVRGVVEMRGINWFNVVSDTDER